MFNLFHRPKYDPADTAMARGLGLTSILIGLAELLMPKKIEQAMGLENGQNTGILRALGVREVMHGVDLLAHEDPAPGVHGRLAGDALDGVLLGLAARKTRNPAGFATIAVMVAGVVAMDVLLAKRLNES